MRGSLHCTENATETYEVRLASSADRQAIYRIRHDVYADELGQHPSNAEGELRDPLDEFNEYIVVSLGERITGFVSITPPGGPRYSLDKYLDRSEWPFTVDAGLYEVRLLTVVSEHRSGPTAMLLMHAAQRYLEERQATRAIAIGRRDILGLYLRVGFERLGPSFLSGAVRYDLMSVEVDRIPEKTRRFETMLRSIEPRVRWRLDGAFITADSDESRRTIATGSCLHGGASFAQIGAGFEALDRRHDVISADVLDAWFPPAPDVIDEIQEHLDWVLRTSPPTDCAGFIDAVSRIRGVPGECVLPGGGSSDLIFRALPRWVTPNSRALLLDPSYGEYRHVLQNVIGCRVEPFFLRAESDFSPDLEDLARRIQDDYDLVVIVNPNNPTGTYIPGEQLKSVLARARPETRIWIDEAYIDYVPQARSLESFAARSQNAVVCKSLSKAYALSGARAGYLCGSPRLIESLRPVTPPWAVGLPAQIAAVLALRNRSYYEARYEETRQLRSVLKESLENLGLCVWPGAANFLLCRTLDGQMDAATLVARCRQHGLFLRNVSSMTSRPDASLFRIAVKDARTNARMVAILGKELTADACAPAAGRDICYA